MNAYGAKIEKVMSAPRIYTAGKMILVIVISRMQIMGVYPFGIAYAAVFAEENAIFALFSLIMGTLALGVSVSAKYILAALIYGVTVYLRKFKNSQVKAVALGVSVAAASAVALFRGEITASRIIMIIPEAFAAGGLYYLFSGDKKEGILEYGKEIIIAGAFLGGIYGLKIPYISADAALLAGMLVIMSVSYSCGIPYAVLTGAALGFMIFIKSPNVIEMTGMLAVSSAISAALSKTGKAGASAGFLSGLTISVLLMGKLGALSVVDIFTAPVVFLLLPEKAAVKIGGRVNDIFRGTEYGEEREKIAKRLKTVAQAMGDLGSGVKSLSVGAQGEKDVLSAVFERTCKGCRNQGRCFGETENIFDKAEELKDVMEHDGFLNYSNAPKKFKQNCIRAEKFLSEFSHMYELSKQDAVNKGEAVFDRNIAVNQYGEFSDIISGLSQTVTTVQKEEEKTEKYSVTVAVRQEPRVGQKISGDTVIHFKNGNKYFVILCDGMGSGQAAREISSLAARLFEEFFCSGIDKKSAVNMINSALSLNADRESFSSADILEIDLATGEAEFLKIGSAQSFIKRGFEIEEITSSTLPIGILENISVTPQKCTLARGDVVLMVSDGVGEASSGVMKNEWIKKLLLSKKKEDDELAGSLLESAKARARYSDDMTSVIVRIKEE